MEGGISEAVEGGSAAILESCGEEGVANEGECQIGVLDAACLTFFEEEGGQLFDFAI
jgi:hypothetical protein